jgi:hypothetical protein
MRVHPIDDHPFHQAPTPFNVVATSDPHFNDGYWFSFYAPGWYFVCGLRLHPNTNTIDGFAGCTHDGEERSVRVSRALRPRYQDLRVGPFRIELVEPLVRQRLVLEDNPSELELDVTFEAQGPPFVETRYQHMKYGRLVNDVLRYTQICRASGFIRPDGTEIACDRWHAMRDHSWGVRSTMGPPSPIGGVERTDEERDDRALRLWVPFEVDDHSGFFHTHEDRSGTTLDVEGRLDFPDGSSLRVISVKHALTYEAGTTHLTGGRFSLQTEDGSWRDYDVNAAGTPADVQGFGYYGGWHDGGSAGVYRGAETIEHDRYPVGPGKEKSGPPHVPERKRLGPTEYPCVMTGPGGSQGMAHVEHHVFGAYDPYSFG